MSMTDPIADLLTAAQRGAGAQGIRRLSLVPAQSNPWFG